MSNKAREDQLNKEIEEMESIMMGETTVEETTEEVVTEATPAELEPEVTVEDPSVTELSQETVVEVVEQVDEKPAPKKRTNWKKRYTELRSYHDSLVYELRSELASVKDKSVRLSEENMKLLNNISELNSNSTKDDPLFTQEEVDVLGEETIQALQKASQKITENAVNPLKEQLDIERKTRLELEEREAQKAKNEAVSSFLSRLGNIVPDYKEIDVDPGFASWMEDIDPLSGYARKILFKRAESNGDVGRVAEFFNQFKSERMGIDTHDPLANHVTPTGSQAQAQSQQVSEDKKILSMDAINEFYDDAAKGRYKNNMSVFREKEKLIEKAMMEGRVR